MKHIKTIQVISLFVPTIYTLWLYGYIGSFTRLMGDSLCSFYYAERLGLLRSIWYWRISWSGRYSAYAADWAILKIFGEKGVPLIIPLTLIIWLSATVWVFYLILQKNFDVQKPIFPSLLFGTFFVFLVLALSPDIQQSLFWLDGMRAYLAPLILLTIYYALYLSLKGKFEKGTGLRIASVVTFFLVIFSAGFSETFAVFQFCLFIFAVLCHWVFKQTFKMDMRLTLLIAGFLGSAVSLAIIISAPGNLVRQGMGSEIPNAIDILVISTQGYGQLISNILYDPVKVVTLIGIGLGAYWLGIAYGKFVSDHIKKIAILCIGAVILSYICIPPGVYGYFEPPPGRVLIIPVFIFSAFILLALFILGGSKSTSLENKAQIENILFAIAFVAVGVSSSVISISHLRDKSIYTEFAQEWDRVDAQIEEAKAQGQTVVYVSSMENWARLETLNNNRYNWVNECYSAYYGIQVFGPP